MALVTGKLLNCGSSEHCWGHNPEEEHNFTTNQRRPARFQTEEENNYQKSCPRAKKHLWRAAGRPGISRYNCLKVNGK